MSRIDTRLKAMAHEGRRDMLRSTLTMEKSASDLARVSGLSRPAASQHLSVLLDSGLMRVRSEGRRRWYRADPGAIAQVRRELDSFWSGKLEVLKSSAES